jgi:hypothetical protein
MKPTNLEEGLTLEQIRDFLSPFVMGDKSLNSSLYREIPTLAGVEGYGCEGWSNPLFFALGIEDPDLAKWVFEQWVLALWGRARGCWQEWEGSVAPRHLVVLTKDPDGFLDFNFQAFRVSHPEEVEEFRQGDAEARDLHLTFGWRFPKNAVLRRSYNGGLIWHGPRRTDPEFWEKLRAMYQCRSHDLRLWGAHT